MKTVFHQSSTLSLPITEELTSLNLKDSIEKTRQALEIAYSGFDNAIGNDLIDSYIYEINSLSKRYEHLTGLAALEEKTSGELSNKHSAIKALFRHAFH